MATKIKETKRLRGKYCIFIKGYIHYGLYDKEHLYYGMIVDCVLSLSKEKYSLTIIDKASSIHQVTMNKGNLLTYDTEAEVKEDFDNLHGILIFNDFCDLLKNYKKYL